MMADWMFMSMGIREMKFENRSSKFEMGKQTPRLRAGARGMSDGSDTSDMSDGWWALSD
jgi:hypothetical protein